MKKLQHDLMEGKSGAASASPSTLPLANELPRDQRPLDAWTERVMANVKLMATDETYRRHVDLLALGDPSAWRRHREAISSAESKSSTLDT